MAIIFVDSGGGNDANDGSTEALAKKTITGASGAASIWTASDTIKLKSTHNETTGIGSAGARSMTFPATPGLRMASVAFDGSGTGALTPGAVIDVGAAAASLTIGSGFSYIYGITFAAGTNNSTASDLNIGSGTGNSFHVLENCTLSLPSVNTGALLNLGIAATGGAGFRGARLLNCTFVGGNTGAITFRMGSFYIQNLTLSGTAPTTVFSADNGDALDVTVNASDFSGVAYTNLVSVATGRPGKIQFANCKLRSGTSLTTSSFGGPGAFAVICTDCNSGDVQYQYLKECYEGTISTSNAIYQGASNGTESFSLLMTGNANTRFEYPLESPEIVAFNATLSSMTTTVEVTNDGTTFTDAQLWQETMAKVTSGVPLGTWNVADRAADILTAGTNQATSSVSWTGTGGFSSEVKQKLESGSFTPAEVGEIVTVVKLAANDNVYVSPKSVSTSHRQWLASSGRFVNERASDGGGTTIAGTPMRRGMV